MHHFSTKDTNTRLYVLRKHALFKLPASQVPNQISPKAIAHMSSVLLKPTALLHLGLAANMRHARSLNL